MEHNDDILIVDDTLASLKLLSELLRRAGHSVREAPNGELALWTAGNRVPGLILLDVRMPGMNGYEVCRRLKADPRTAAVPVIFLSALDDTDDKIEGFNVGAVDYVSKPFSEREVLARVNTQLSLARLRAELEYERQSLEVKVAERTYDMAQAMESLAAEVQARKAVERKLRLACKAFDLSNDSLFVTDVQGVIVAVNPAFCALTGYSADEAVGQPARLLKSGRHEPAFFQAMWRAILDKGSWSGEVWNRRKDGNVFPCLHTIAASRDEAGDITHFVGTFMDIGERRDTEMLLNFLTRHDALTGLPNRMLMGETFARLGLDLGDSHDVIAVICVDIDRFRTINDMFGHALGDYVLQVVAQRLGDCLQPPAVLFRQGADEFVILRRDEPGLSGTRELIACIYEALGREFVDRERCFTLSVSMGVALYPRDGNTLPELVSHAGTALAEAKGLGGGEHLFFRAQMQEQTRDRFDIEMRLRNALRNGEFRVYYQPQLCLTSGRIIGAEALIRWGTPETGFVPPSSFIPVAEETGSIVPIGRWVLDSVCRQMRQWRDQGLDMKVAVNLSALQFRQSDLCEMVGTALREHGLDAASLELEITESSLIHDVPSGIATMRSLKGIGTSLALDDFGTGYSSLNYLKRFPIDYLKIDQSFVHDIGADPDAAAIVLSILSLAHNLRLKVVAEGVETREQLDYLREHGCDAMQGYYFSRPLPVEEFYAKAAAGEGLSW